MTDAKTSKSSTIPLIASFFVEKYNDAPRIMFPGTSIDIGFTMWCMATFIAARLVTYEVLIRLDWPENASPTLKLASSIVSSSIHATNVIPLTWTLIRTQKPYDPSASPKTSPQWWQDLVEATLQFSTAYMLYDSIFLFFGRGGTGNPNFLIFLCHHILCLFYMTTCRLYGAGQSSVLTCIFFGEITNHFFNLSLCYDCADEAGIPISGIWNTIRLPNEICLAILYLPVRFVISPLLGGYMSYNLLTSKEGRTRIPLLVRLIWVSTMFLVIHGSIGHGMTYYNVLKQFAFGDLATGFEDL